MQLSRQLAYCVLGQTSGNITIQDNMQTTQSVRISVGQPTAINLTQKDFIYITSDVDIGILCNVWIQSEKKSIYRNTFFIPSFHRWTSCSFIDIYNCTDSVCVRVISQNMTNESLQITSSSNNMIIPATEIQFGNKTTSSWEIGYVADAIYRIGIHENIPIIVFKSDLSAGRFSPVDPFPLYLCENISYASINQNSPSNQTLSSSVTQTHILTSGSNVGAVNSTTSTYSVTILNSFIGNETTNQTSSDKTTNNNQTHYSEQLLSGSNVTAKSTYQVDLRSKYAFLYQELPEDDKVLNEYMVAVIVSLGTAIFAVVALITTCLLLEMLSRRRQLGNSKIRPMSA